MEQALPAFALRTSRKPVISKMAFDVGVLIAEREALLAGVVMTLAISSISALLATAIGMTVAVGKKSAIPFLRWGLQAYIQFFRNTPLLVQIYLFYKALPFLGLTLSPPLCGVIALSLQTGAYMAELFRAGIEAIPKEQLEGGLSLGFSRLETYRLVIFPQALRIVLPPYGNQMVGLIKNSSLVAFITVPDLFFVVFHGGAAHFRYLEFFTAGIVLYMLLTLGVSALFGRWEKALSQADPKPVVHYA